MTGRHDRPRLQVRIQRKAGWKREVSHWRTEAPGCRGTLRNISGQQPKHGRANRQDIRQAVQHMQVPAEAPGRS